MQILSQKVGRLKNIKFKKMLKLKNILSDTRKIYNESDYHVKIRIIFEQKEHSSGVCYWNAYGKENSFVEATLYNPIGAIYELTVLFMPFDGNVEYTNMLLDHNVTQRIGFPLFETYLEKYQEGYYHLPDEKINFKLYADKRNISLVFSSNTVTLHVINDAIIFGFDADKNLCYIHMQNMSLNEDGILEQI